MTDVFVEALREAVDGLPAAIRQNRRDPTHYSANPVDWADERAEQFMWSKQREIMLSVQTNSRTAVRTCHNVGKTFTAAAVAAWWIDAHPPGEAFVLTSAPTGVQVKTLLWREIGRLHRRAGLPGRVNMTEWFLGPEIVAYGRKSSDYDDNAFQGVHALRVLVIFDEACGIADTLWVAAESIASNRHSRILAIGNPDSWDTQFARICGAEGQHTEWNVIGVGYQDTPAWTGEEVPPILLDYLISPEWVAAREREWGRESALFQSKCLGQFPDKELDVWSVIPYGFISKCRTLDRDEPSPDMAEELVQAGIDVGGGGDSTVVAERIGNRAGRVLEFKNPDPMATVGQIALALSEWGVKRAKVDVGGIGWGIFGRLRELQGQTHDAEIVPINFGARASNPNRFLNKRAELWWNGRELARKLAWDLNDVSDSMVSQLIAPRYEILDSGGKIKIEKKEDVIERLGRSPDEADALLLAFFDGAGTGTVDLSAIETFARAGSAGTIMQGKPAHFGSGASPFGNAGGRPGVGGFGSGR